MLECRYLIIGAGQSGLILASQIGQMGHSVILVEQAQIGGTYLHTYDFPRQILIQESDAFALSLNSFKDNPATFNALLKHRQKLSLKLAKKITQNQQEIIDKLAKLPNVKILKGWAEFSSKSLVEVNSDTERHLVTFQEAFICVGKNLMTKPDLKGLEKIDFLYQHNVYSLKNIPASLGILGVTTQSLEVADIYSKLGVKVIIFEKDSTQNSLSQIDRTGLNYLYKKLLTRQVELRFGTEIQKTQIKKNQIQLTLSSGEIMEVSHLYCGVDESFGEENLGLAHLGIKVTNAGIQTDPSGRIAGQKYIWAFGDCSASTTNSNKQAQILNQVERIRKGLNPQIQNSFQSSFNILQQRQASATQSFEFKPLPGQTTRISSEVALLGLSEGQSVAQFGPQIKTFIQEYNGLDGFIKLIYKETTGALTGIVLCGDLARKLETFSSLALDKKLTCREFIFFVQNTLGGL